MLLAEEDMKARLMVEDERVIDGLVANAQQKGTRTITEIERMVGQMGQQLMAQVTRMLVEAEGEEEEPREC